MNRPSLMKTAYETIRGWIASGRLQEGTVTSENALAGQLDMSRTPIRAALQQLETEGYLRIVPKHGVLILHASAQRVGDLLEMLTALLLFAYEQHKRTRFGEIAEAAAEFAGMLDVSCAAGREAPEALVAFEAELWQRLLSLGHNREIVHLGQTTLDRLQWNINHRRWRPPFRAETERLLRGMAAAMRDPDGPGPDFFAYLRILKRTWS